MYTTTVYLAANFSSQSNTITQTDRQTETFNLLQLHTSKGTALLTLSTITLQTHPQAPVKREVF